jgi:hypothetical protein
MYNLDGKGNREPFGPNVSRKSIFQTHTYQLAAYALHTKKVQLRIIHDLAHSNTTFFPRKYGICILS